MTDIDKLIEELREYATDWRDRAASKDVVVKATDTIAAQRKRIEELEAYTKLLEGGHTETYLAAQHDASVKISRQKARIEELESALRGIMSVGEPIEGELISHWVKVVKEHFIIASKALKGGSDNG